MCFYAHVHRMYYVPVVGNIISDTFVRNKTITYIGFVN